MKISISNRKKKTVFSLKLAVAYSLLWICLFLVLLVNELDALLDVCLELLDSHLDELRLVVGYLANSQ